MDSLPNEVLMFIAECLPSAWDVLSFVQVNRKIHNAFHDFQHSVYNRYFGGISLLWAVREGEKRLVKKFLLAGPAWRPGTMKSMYLERALLQSIQISHSGITTILIQSDETQR